MALLRGEMRSVDGSVLYCTCEHHKVAVPTPRENLEVRVEWDEWWDREEALKEKAKI
jgi:acyl-coenzyme A thioesterase 13